MQYFYITLILIVIFMYNSNGQNLREVNNIRLHEHHRIITSEIGDSSAYDFINHKHINSILGEHDSMDMVEFGDANPSSESPFMGWKSDTSTAGMSWVSDLYGNGTTKFQKVEDITFETVQYEDIVQRYNNTLSVHSVMYPEPNDLYIAKLRDEENYILIKIVDVIINEDEMYIAFDYKYNSEINSISFEEKRDYNFEIYPNPATEYLVFKSSYISSNPKNTITLRMFSTIGDTIWEQVVKPRATIVIPLKDLNQGLYYLSVRQKTEENTMIIVHL